MVKFCKKIVPLNNESIILNMTQKKNNNNNFQSLGCTNSWVANMEI